VHIPANAIREGLCGVSLAGRFQVLPGRPSIVLDVAHNPHAARALAATLGAMGYFPETIAVFGMLADKDIAGVIAALAARVDRWFVATVPGPRGASADALRRSAHERRRRLRGDSHVRRHRDGVRRGARGRRRS
jgi:dihydrofolate synthase/folylpolyglutamate synthase